MASTVVSDIVIPRVFAPYIRTRTEEKSRIIQSGAVARSTMLDEFLAGGGKTFDIPGFNDLAQTAENVASNNPATTSTPDNITTHTQIGVRLSRNMSWGSMDLAQALAGADPLGAIQELVSTYWARRLQKMLIAMVAGISKDNGANDSGDYAHEVVGSGFVDGVTNFTAEAVIDAMQTMGDSTDDLSMLMVHSIVYARMRKNNLIDFIRDSEGGQIAMYQGAMVVVDDGMPAGTSAVRKNGDAGVAGMYESWLFGPGAVRLGVGEPRVPVEVDRLPSTGNGSGQEVLYSRVEWLPHLLGHAYIGTAPDGGPDNTANTHMLAAAGSWNRVWSDRKMIKFARLITREAAA